MEGGGRDGAAPAPSESVSTRWGWGEKKAFPCASRGFFAVVVHEWLNLWVSLDYANVPGLLNEKLPAANVTLLEEPACERILTVLEIETNWTPAAVRKQKTYEQIFLFFF